MTKGYEDIKLQELIDEFTVEFFYSNATLNKNVHLIKGVVCGYRVEEIENTLTRQARYLDKLVDELARGRKRTKDEENFKEGIIDLVVITKVN